MATAPLRNELHRLLGHEPGPYECEPLAHNAGNMVTADIARYRGDGWSVVRKQVAPTGVGRAHWAASDEPRHWNYWQREVLAYRRGSPRRHTLAAG